MNQKITRNDKARSSDKSDHTYVDSTLPRVTIGVRFHDPKRSRLLERCLTSLGAQVEVTVHVVVALQGFSDSEEEVIRELCEVSLQGSGFTFEIVNIPNPEDVDLRAALLNEVVDIHYERGLGNYLAFIDFDDIWFQKALVTLVRPLEMGEFALSYADIHCADVYYDNGQVYLRDIRDVFGISEKTKRHLMRDNFLPLHSYMFHTGRLDRDVLRYDPKLKRLEDYDVLLSVAQNHAFSGMHRNRLIGLYNFYTLQDGDGNTTRNIFDASGGESSDENWDAATREIIGRHAGKKWQEFWGEEWIL